MSWNPQESWQEPRQTFLPADVRDERVTAFLARVYGWMFAGLLITAVTAFVIASSPALVEAVLGNRLVFWVVVIAQLGLVFYLSGWVERVQPLTAAALFLVYSALVGVTTSVVLLVFTAASIAQTFVVTAGMFGALALFGTVTKRSLAGIGHFMFMGLIGLVLASIVGIFWHSNTLQFVISFVGVIVFTGLTAWDAQRLKQMALQLSDVQVGSYSVVGALSLYLDFINLFFFLLRFMGNRRD
jgi:uncharacterized protein